LAGFLARTTPSADPLGVLVVLVDIVRAVAIADVEAAVGREGDVRGPVALAVLVDARFLREAHLPHGLALERRLDDRAVGRHMAEIKDPLPAPLADVDAVPAEMELLAEGADVLPLRVEHDDRVHDVLALSLVGDVDEAGRIDGNAVRGLPADRGGKLAPVMKTFVTVRVLADDGVLGTGLVRGTEDGRAGARREGSGARRGLLQEFTSFHDDLRHLGSRTFQGPDRRVRPTGRTVYAAARLSMNAAFRAYHAVAFVVPGWGGGLLLAQVGRGPE